MIAYVIMGGMDKAFEKWVLVWGLGWDYTWLFWCE